jgi:hypothetical protein
MKNISDMSLQEIADYVMEALVNQGKRCIAEDGCCVYGTEKRDHHCAVGWLLDKEDDDLMDFEGNVTALVRNFPDKVPEIIKDNLVFFGKLQNFHDHAADYELLVEEFGLSRDRDYWSQWLVIHGSTKEEADKIVAG